MRQLAAQWQDSKLSHGLANLQQPPTATQKVAAGWQQQQLNPGRAAVTGNCPMLAAQA
jgi:hypothetical protein